MAEGNGRDRTGHGIGRRGGKGGRGGKGRSRVTAPKTSIPGTATDWHSHPGHPVLIISSPSFKNVPVPTPTPAVHIVIVLYWQ